MYFCTLTCGFPFKKVIFKKDFPLKKLFLKKVFPLKKVFFSNTESGSLSV